MYIMRLFRIKLCVVKKNMIDYLYKFESFKFKIRNFGFREKNFSIDGKRGYKCGCSVTFFLSTDSSNHAVISSGDKFKTSVTVVRYYLANTYHL